MIRKKVCMLGSFAVGKTSLVVRYVKSLFSERYETTVGVQIHKKELRLGGDDVALVLWDLHGEDEFQRLRDSYLRGASGYLLVADGTRLTTVHQARDLDARARAVLGDVPRLLLLNKRDLDAEWEVTAELERELAADGLPVLATSARSGDGVEEAFRRIAADMLRPRGGDAPA